MLLTNPHEQEECVDLLIYGVVITSSKRLLVLPSGFMGDQVHQKSTSQIIHALSVSYGGLKIDIGPQHIKQSPLTFTEPI